MTQRELTQCVADFYFPENENVLTADPAFVAWRRETRWASGLYQPTLASAPGPRSDLSASGRRHHVLNFTSYSYLGLGRHPEVIARAQAALLEFGTGSAGSPMLSGRTVLSEELERALSAFLGRESTILFNSGFAGSLGTMTGLLRKGDVAICDSQFHCSAIDGVRLSGAKLVLFDHNDPGSLDAALAKEKGKRVLVAVEGVYSMDGDMADLPALLEVTGRHGAPLYIDEAHSILACGPNGGGVVDHYGVRERVGLVFGTFSKAFCAVGGFTSGDRDTLDYLHCFANPYTFSSGPAPSVIGGILGALAVAQREPERRARLAENAAYLRGRLNGLGVSTGASTTHVIPIMVGADRVMLYETCAALREAGLFVAPVDYPAVPEDKLRFRACVSAEHTREDLDGALNIVADIVVPRLRAAGALAN